MDMSEDIANALEDQNKILTEISKTLKLLVDLKRAELLK